MKWQASDPVDANESGLSYKGTFDGSGIGFLVSDTTLVVLLMMSQALSPCS